MGDIEVGREGSEAAPFSGRFSGWSPGPWNCCEGTQTQIGAGSFVLQAPREVLVRNYFCLKRFSPSALFKTRGFSQGPSGLPAAHKDPSVPRPLPMEGSSRPSQHTEQAQKAQRDLGTDQSWHWGQRRFAPEFYRCLMVLQTSAGVPITLCFRWSWVQIHAKVTSGKCNMRLDQFLNFFLFFLLRRKLPARGIMLFLEKSLILGSFVGVGRTKSLLCYAYWVVCTDMNLHLLSQKDIQDYFLSDN